MIETLFSIANILTMVSWLSLIILPRCPLLIAVLRYGGISLLSLAYAVFALVHFADAPGGFRSLQEVQALFTSSEMVSLLFIQVYN